MDGIEDRVRVLEKQVRRYRILNVAVATILLAWVGYATWNLMHLQQRVVPLVRSDPSLILRVKRLEIGDDVSTRPTCVLRTEQGGGRIEAFNRDDVPIAGFDGNRGLVVRSGDAAQFPK